MENLWIAESAGAALCQALRYATLKELNKYLSTLVSTYVRLLFSFPLQIPYDAADFLWTSAALPSLNRRFLIVSAGCMPAGAWRQAHLLEIIAGRPTRWGKVLVRYGEVAG